MLSIPNFLFDIDNIMLEISNINYLNPLFFLLPIGRKPSKKFLT